MSHVNSEARPGAVLGWSGFLAGAASLLLALMLFWGGPLAPVPEPVAEPSLAERAVDAARGILGGAPEAEPAPVPVAPGRSIDDWLVLAVPGLGALAVILGLAGMARREPPRPAVSAVTLGGGAIVFQLLTGFILILVVLMLLGTVSRGGDSVGEVLSGILDAISGVLTAIGDFFGNLFGGLFGG